MYNHYCSRLFTKFSLIESTWGLSIYLDFESHMLFATLFISYANTWPDNRFMYVAGYLFNGSIRIHGNRTFYIPWLQTGELSCINYLVRTLPLCCSLFFYWDWNKCCSHFFKNEHRQHVYIIRTASWMSLMHMNGNLFLISFQVLFEEHLLLSCSAEKCSFMLNMGFLC